jgi:cytochrome c oxidase subunit IV
MVFDGNPIIVVLFMVLTGGLALFMLFGWHRLSTALIAARIVVPGIVVVVPWIIIPRIIAFPGQIIVWLL